MNTDKRRLKTGTMMLRRRFLRASGIAPVVLARAPRLFAADYDLVIHGGRVLDASQHIDRIDDVWIRGSRIAAIRSDVAPTLAKEVIDARGKLVTPGLT